MSGWWNQRSRPTRLLVYAVAAILAFVMAAGVGAGAALLVGGNLSWPTGERGGPGEPHPASERDKPPQRQQDDADGPQQEKAGAGRERPATQDRKISYVSEVGEIQADSVEVFSDSHKKLRRYDTLTSDDIDEMQANQVALRGFTDQASGLKAPRQYREQKDAFVSGIDKLRHAAQLAYTLAADPISATQAGFDDYDRLVDEAAADLRRSNEILGKDYKTIGDLQEVNTP